MYVKHRVLTIIYTNVDPNNNKETNYEILGNVETKKIEKLTITDKNLRIRLDIIGYSE